MKNTAQVWYIVKQQDQTCEIVAAISESSPIRTSCWGPFSTYQDAISKRIGLIRAGKCQPQ